MGLPAASPLAVRHTARLIVLDPADRVLLIKYEAARDLDPARPGERGFWYTPGGGLDPGETHEQAARRELAEETGITEAAIGPCVALWDAPVMLFRRQAFTYSRFFLVRAPSDRLDTSQLAGTENDPVLDVRWWAAGELAATREHVEPAAIVPVILGILRGEVPAAPAVVAPAVVA
jgi:8-oxo-dGTP pyrophosphatase MutT (NUDIX family)